MGFLNQEQLKDIGFCELGTNVLISEKASIYNPDKITIGSNVRIDDFCILSAGEKGIKIGDYVHIACYVSLIGSEIIKINDFVGISARTSVYSSSDDYSGNFLSGPTIPDRFKNVNSSPVVFESHSIIGAGCVILPGCVIGEGTAVGALSLVLKSLSSWGVFAGIPVKYIKPRKHNMLKYISSLKE
jgi:galactoside O-acetyltransferase